MHNPAVQALVLGDDKCLQELADEAERSFSDEVQKGQYREKEGTLKHAREVEEKHD